VLDARRGPISIDAGAVIQPFTRIEGPCHIGKGSQLFRANVREGTTIGPVCRVGGEVEASILHGWVNKYHEGFLGHSYVCPWVNIAALSTTSDLKSDYSNVSVPLSGEMVPTGLMKVGCFIGDHTKTTLASLFNTGSSVGVMCLLVSGGELMPKHVPSFSWLKPGRSPEEWSVDRGLETARTAMDRRRMTLTPAQERLYRTLFEMTHGERSQAVERVRQKAASRG
jgi:UDP-N-acetylglucosamine diphosphorylase/glucosamine-1-phosphate N-acetyltransferase